MGETAAFPVSWEQPDDPDLFWKQERRRFPDPVLPLVFSLEAAAFPPSVAAAARRYHLPLAEMRARRINGYLYGALVPLSETAEERAARDRRAHEALSAVMERLGERWHEVWLPAVKQLLSFWDEYDLENAGQAALLSHVEATVARYRALWKIHTEIMLPAWLAVSLFVDFYRQLFPEAEPFAPYELLRGFDNKTLERDRWLWRLSRRALVMDKLRDLFLSQPAADLQEALQASSEGRVFMAEVDDLLVEFGAAWPGDRVTPLAIIQKYVNQPARDLEGQLANLARRRQAAKDEAAQALRAHPPAARKRFRFLLKAAQQGAVLHEDHAYWIDQLGREHILDVFRTCGRRLAQSGALAAADDVMYLTVDEVRVALVGPTASLPVVVQKRRTEMAHFAQLTPPPVLGTPPAGPPPANPVSRALARVSGTPPVPAAAADTIRGHAGSPGRACGRVRVLREPAGAERLQPGEILVAPTTSPAWTPLFATAAALITDTGGVLCHGACVAREYGTPAVVGTGDATARLHDGQLVEVDGSNGVVRILE